jgi:cyclic pyranopterin monophosphate synthase
VIKEILEKNGLSNVQRMIVSDDVEAIQAAFKNSLSEVPQLIILSGGTGVSPRDNTPEAIGPLLEKRLPGVEELMRAYGQQHTPYAMLSRSMAGICRNALVLALPGSAKGVRECLSATMPHILHAFSMMQGEGH